MSTRKQLRAVAGIMDELAVADWRIENGKHPKIVMHVGGCRRTLAISSTPRCREHALARIRADLKRLVGASAL